MCPHICTCRCCRNVEFEKAHMELFGLPPLNKCCDMRHAKTIFLAMRMPKRKDWHWHMFSFRQNCICSNVDFLVSTINIFWYFGLWMLNVPTWVYGKLQIRKCCAMRYAMQFISCTHAERKMVLPMTNLFISIKTKFAATLIFVSTHMHVLMLQECGIRKSPQGRFGVPCGAPGALTAPLPKLRKCMISKCFCSSISQNIVKQKKYIYIYTCSCNI